MNKLRLLSAAVRLGVFNADATLLPTPLSRKVQPHKRLPTSGVSLRLVHFLLQQLGTKLPGAFFRSMDQTTCSPILITSTAYGRR
ncbi:hypothetical protein [Paenibacillus prosopidis]|uniref:hypothetical protein n=1 Tax=Paenibacillus prosopidis TaxID=630520 RepID=UPI0011C04672|nr:hypothetical protein [Paenibacillus prosopidis]